MYIYIKTSNFSVQSLSHVWLFATPWTAACQASLSITNSWSLHKLMSIELVMPFNHLILCHLLLLLPSVFPSIRVFSSESVLHIRWTKCWSFSFSISPSNSKFLIYVGASLAAQLQCGRPGFDSWVGMIPWRRERLPTPEFWPGV